MKSWLRLFALCYAAGTAGALAEGGAVWVLRQFAVSAGFAAQLAGAQHGGLYARLVWAGLFGLLFALPMLRSSLLLRGVLVGSLVALLQALIIPLLQHAGLHLLAWSTLWLWLASVVWGIAAAAVLRLLQ